ncbi:MAG TPA: sensor histidine kinase [Candidatus Binatia bacterium]|nr:sensor histidine kinase [Candidatus Binatia bacterium]
MTNPGRSAPALLSPLPQHKLIERFGIALGVAALAVLLRAFLDPALGHVAFYATVYMAVAWSAIVCGLAPSIVTTLAGFFGILYWFVDPRHSLSVVRRPPEIHAIIGFFLVCSVLIALGVANRRKQIKLDGIILALTAEAAERQRAEQELKKAHDQLEERVEERTAALSQALSRLRTEVQVRERAEEQLRHLTVRPMTTQEEERRRIARELHDSAGQTLAAIKMTMASLQFNANKGANVASVLGELNGLVDEVLQEIRTASYLLHPPLLDEAGIASAARWFVEGFAKRSGIQMVCSIPDRVERQPRVVELVLFRVLQESLTNVHRHSGASSASVSLEVQKTKLRLEIRDNGTGITGSRLSELSGSAAASGVGIAGMRERLRELGGTLEIDSRENGTTVTASLPLMQVSPGKSGAGMTACNT